ncbi:hypothetical protein [Listeria valentina]|uniref:hypothetical protein n=1 Tax=Listeria valentina TaxID=2705293 RepID=UPI0014318D6F|nr:hypothetical protein [Listeria valentina]
MRRERELPQTLTTIAAEHFNKEAPVSYSHLKWQTPSNPYSPASILDADIVMDAK